MSRHYQHLNATGRAMTRLLDDKGQSVREIVRRIGRPLPGDVKQFKGRPVIAAAWWPLVQDA